MKITVDLPDEEIYEMAKELAAKRITSSMIEHSYGDGYAYRKIIKEVVREVIKSDIDNLSERAVAAAAKSIERRAIKNQIDKLMEETDE